MSKERISKPALTKQDRPKSRHIAVFIDNRSDKSYMIDELMAGNTLKGFEQLQGLRGTLYSKLALTKLIDEESRHGQTEVSKNSGQSLQSMSSGEQKKALLKHLLRQDPEYIILDNPFDNLDKASQIELKQHLKEIAQTSLLVQIISRKDDLLPFISNPMHLIGRELVVYHDIHTIPTHEPKVHFNGTIPPPLEAIEFDGKTLIELKKVNVSYHGKPIVRDIDWKIGRGEFWELSGRNGSGKTTILSMITGENPKGYGQDLFLFGYKKGSGESVWDIKKNIGYFTPSMTDKFTGYHSIEHMMISGILDSIGLYVRPTEAQLRLAKEWLMLIAMWEIKDKHFHDLTMGQKRLVMTTRAMIKHPLLLILDEPTAGLDDESAALLVSLVNKIAAESNSTIIFVSHRTEKGLNPDFVFELKTTDQGSIGSIN